MGKRVTIAAAVVLVVGTAGASATYGRSRAARRAAVRPAATTVRHVPAVVVVPPSEPGVRKVIKATVHHKHHAARKHAA